MSLLNINCFGVGIRTVKVNDTKMEPIKLAMGKASVLRFSEKPKKVVIGNQNYYKVEFIDNDLTIQPLGDVETNIFVYTPYHTYGFILKVCASCNYDDLVYVKWKSKYIAKKKKRDKKKVVKRSLSKRIGARFSIGEQLSVYLIGTRVAVKRPLKVVDLYVLNRGMREKSLSSLKFTLVRNKIPLTAQSYVIEKDSVRPKEASKIRILFPLKESRNLVLETFYLGRKYRFPIAEKYLK